MESTFKKLFPLLFTIVHLWTCLLAGDNGGGSMAFVVSFILPILAELYWMIKLFSSEVTYAVVTLVSIILFIPYYRLLDFDK